MCACVCVRVVCVCVCVCVCVPVAKNLKLLGGFGQKSHSLSYWPLPKEAAEPSGEVDDDAGLSPLFDLMDSQNKNVCRCVDGLHLSLNKRRGVHLT